MLEALLGKSAEDIASAVIEAARRGDMTAARIVLDRVLPAKKDRAVEFALPQITGADSLLRAGEAVLAAVAAGMITPLEAEAMMTLLERHRRFVETADHEVRIAGLEQQTAMRE
ncbi:MAG TPA: hypothetical protein VGU01_14685 [Sphingomicrobium sp.]|nr:hypothetical protein [Sphingomicrobium sp.]